MEKDACMKHLMTVGGIDKAFERVHASKAGVLDPDPCIDTREPHACSFHH